MKAIDGSKWRCYLADFRQVASRDPAVEQLGAQFLEKWEPKVRLAFGTDPVKLWLPTFQGHPIVRCIEPTSPNLLPRALHVRPLPALLSQLSLALRLTSSSHEDLFSFLKQAHLASATGLLHLTFPTAWKTFLSDLSIFLPFRHWAVTSSMELSLPSVLSSLPPQAPPPHPLYPLLFCLHGTHQYPRLCNLSVSLSMLIRK
ncbi:uncharacterized protein LOC109266402 [Panthera pardus]|uniref:Uncharacterized protein LOC109266402 n=1 Tax=Panthera pardus TaxID=9691 RepID=A0A9V1FJH2_PANPR|nr:uncharacterized protein LOC109266402 [Panthera pardus]